ncbi:MAG: DUF4878 domain-containing protein [Succinivibrio sp.]|nr:DUF4878 domain-containing protein [Succinivibrio sp.]
MPRIIYAALFICQLFLLSACSSGEKSPEVLGEELIAALYNGDSSQVIALVNLDSGLKENNKSPELTKVINGKLEAATRQSRNKAIQNGGVKEIVVTRKDMDTDQNRCTVYYQIYFNKNPQPQTEKVSFLKEKGHWKIVF